MCWLLILVLLSQGCRCWCFSSSVPSHVGHRKIECWRAIALRVFVLRQYCHGGRSWLGPDPKGGGGGPPLYGPQNCRTEQCALSAPEAPEMLF